MRGLTHQIFEYLRQHAWLRRKAKPQRRNVSKLHLEPLEDRFLPATSVSQLVPAALTGTAFIDHNHNNVLDAGEIVLPGATVTLTGKDFQGTSVTATAVTDANGVYKILQLNPGTYQINLATNQNFLLGNGSAGSNGGIVSGNVVSSIAITQGETLVGYNLAVEGLTSQGISLRQFLSSTIMVNGIPVSIPNTPAATPGTGVAYADGAPPPANITPVLTATGTGSLSGFVKDTAGNPIANVKIGLTGITGGGPNAGLPTNALATTDATGAYAFNNLAAGSYSINLPSQPPGFRAGVPVLGSLDGSIRQNDLFTGIDVTTTAGSGYNFVEIAVTEPSGSAPALEAHLVDDTAGISAGSANGPGGAASDSLTSDPTVGGLIVNVGQITSFTGSLDSGAAVSLPIPGANGSFILSTLFMNQIAGGTLGDGSHTLHLHATGTTGSASTSLFFTLKTSSPLVPVIHLDTNSDPSQNGRPIASSVNILGTTSPGATVKLFSGTSTIASVTATANASGDFTFTQNLASGPNDFTFVAIDNAGNLSQAQATYVVDRAPTGSIPNVSVNFSSPTPNQVLDLAGDFTDPDTSNSIIQINTSLGPVNVTLLDGQDPLNVTNFLNYIKSGRFDNTIFHRLVTGFIIQGGAFTLAVAPTTITPVVIGPPIKNEFPATPPAGGINLRGTIAMAKTSDPNSATSQFFFNLANNLALDSTTNSGGFPIFASIADGFSQRIVDLLASAPTQDQSKAPGTAINEVQQVSINGSPTGGTFTLSLNGVASAPLAFNATAGQIQAAVAALPSPLTGVTGPIGAANVNVTGSAGTFTVTFTFPAPNAGATVPLLGSFSNLTGGISPSVSVTQITPGQPTNTALGGSQAGIPLVNYSGTNFPTDATAANFELVKSVTIMRNSEFLTYSIAKNTDPTIATPSLDPTFNNRLTLQFLKPGTTSITVVATDLSNQSVSSTFTVTVNPATSALIPLIANQTFTAAVGSANGTVVGTVQASDPNPGSKVVKYEIIAGNTNNTFGMDIASGQITVLDHTQLDLTKNTSFALTVRATNNAATVSSATATITINLVANSAPTISNQALNVAEGSANGTVLGNVVASGANGQSINYAITAGNTDGTFQVNSGTGSLSVANNTDLVQATHPTIPLTVQVTDTNATPLNKTATVTVNVTANHAPTVAANQSFNVTTGAANGAVVGTVAASDPDPGQTLTYAITAGNTNTDFAINSANGQITVANSASLAADTPFTLQVTATDNAATPLSSLPTPVTVQVVPANNGPTIAAQSFDVVEGSPVGTPVGIPVAPVVATNAADGKPLTYAITAGNINNTFQIDPASGQISVANNAQLNIAVFPTIPLVVQVMDSAFPNPTSSATITINLKHNTAPSISNQSFSVPHTSPVGFTFGPVVATDPDTNQLLTYTITAGNTGNTFTIDPNTGILKVADTTDLTIAQSPFNLTITVKDNDLRPFSASATVTVTIT